MHCTVWSKISRLGFNFAVRFGSDLEIMGLHLLHAPLSHQMLAPANADRDMETDLEHKLDVALTLLLKLKK